MLKKQVFKSLWFPHVNKFLSDYIIYYLCWLSTVLNCCSDKWKTLYMLHYCVIDHIISERSQAQVSFF